jgi:hypothetical protein
MGVILKRIGLILMFTHACTIVGMENHNWWPNGRDADPVPPSAMNMIREFVAKRVAQLPLNVRPIVCNSIEEGLMSKEFSIEDAVQILERFEDEQDRLEQEQEKEDRRLCFFPSWPNQEDEAEQIESQ